MSEQTDAEWLIEWIEDVSHNNAFRIERARERMARVVEELEEAQQLEMNIQRQAKIINGLEMANATLRAKNEVLSDWRDSWRRV